MCCLLGVAISHYCNMCESIACCTFSVHFVQTIRSSMNQAKRVIKAVVVITLTRVLCASSFLQPVVAYAVAIQSQPCQKIDRFNVTHWGMGLGVTRR